MSYVPGTYAGGKIETYIQEELEKIADVLLVLEDGPLNIRNVAPDKPRNGLYYADGTDWDPGSGKGVYRYEEGVGYTFLG